MTDLFYSFQNYLIMGFAGLGLFLMLRRGMSGRLKALGLFVLLSGLGLILIQPKAQIVWHEYSPDLVKQVMEQEKGVVLYFSADWCYPCYQLDRFTFTQAELADSMRDFYKIKVDVSNSQSLEVKEVVKEFKIFSIPELLFMVKESNGKVREKRLSGYRSAREIMDMLQRF